MKFNDFFRNVNIPVIVYRDDEIRKVVYANRSAIMQFSPLSVDGSWSNIDYEEAVSNFLKLPKGDFENFIKLLNKSEDVTGFSTSVLLYSGENTPVTLSANKTKVDGEAYVQVFVYLQNAGGLPQSHAQAVAATLNLAYKAKTTDEAINCVLAVAGDYVGASRSFIFESVSETLTSNTYEWCAPGVEPAIDQLKELPKEVYSYNEIIANGMAITDDIRMLGPEDRSILEPQGIKALAVIPIFYNDHPLGYVGFDDCANYRRWTPEEVRFFASLAEMLASLITRRDGERNVRYSLETLKTVTDNSDSIVFVSDIYTDKLLFANSAFALSVASSPGELIGQISMVVLRRWAANFGDCDPLSELIGADGQAKKTTHTWEFHNQTSNKWYLFRGSIIKWIDGREVHLEIGTEITGQKEYEAQLKHDASTDMMTGLYLRERGRLLIQQILDNKSSNENNSLVFIDIDGLKQINDKYGHAAGDRMILKTAELITSHIRKSDTLCRWGGDEFILIVRADEPQTDIIMRKIQAQAEAYNTTGENAFPLGFSYGVIGIVPDSGHTVDSLISEADRKMYRQKAETVG